MQPLLIILYEVYAMHFPNATHTTGFMAVRANSVQSLHLNNVRALKNVTQSSIGVKKIMYEMI